MDQKLGNVATRSIRRENTHQDPEYNPAIDSINEEKSDDNFFLHWSKVADGLQKFREFEYLCDVVLISKSRKEFKAHRLLLAAASSVFQEAFQPVSNSEFHCVELPETNDNTVEIFLQFVYTGRLSLTKEFKQHDKLSALLLSLQNLGIEVDSLGDFASQFDRDSENLDIDNCSNTEEATQSDNSCQMLPREVSSVRDANEMQSDNLQSHRKKTIENVQMPRNAEMKKIVTSGTNSEINGNFVETKIDLDQEVKQEVEQEDVSDVLLNSSKIAELEMSDEMLDNKIWKQSKTNKIRKHRMSKCIVCQYCGITLSHHSLKSHIQSQHEKTKSFKCKECDLSFTTETGRYKHSKRMHTKSSDGQEMEFICELCGKTYKNSLSLYHHAYQHSYKRKSVKQPPEDTDKHICGYCGKVYTFKSALYMHIRKHDEYGKALPYICQCGKRFAFKSMFLKHQPFHGVSRPFPCSQCDKRFKTKNTMQTHLNKTHVTVRRYVCNLCGDSFKQSHHLAQHMVHHSDARPFACTLCDKAYKVKHDLKLHCRRVHQMELVVNVKIEQMTPT